MKPRFWSRELPSSNLPSASMVGGFDAEILDEDGRLIWIEHFKQGEIADFLDCMPVGTGIKIFGMGSVE